MLESGKRYDGRSREGKWQGSSGRGAALALALVVFCLSGCGYSLRQRLKDGFTNPEGIYVPVFTNTTDEIGAERVFTDALIRELQSRGQVKITHRHEGAYELLGTVASISYTPSALTPTPFGGLQNYRRLPTEIVVTVGVNLQLNDPKTNAVLWAGSFSGFRRVAGVISRTQDFNAPSSVGLMTQSLIESQYAGIARDIMRDVYDAMMELF